jgi:hypothetical protein
MSRLLFAAARGARIQYRSPVDHKWKANFFLPNFLTDSLYRIHPNDEHLQYGPISTALREMAEDNSYRGGWEGYFAHVAANEFAEYFDSWQGKPDNSLFYLILAEALADEGM